MSEKNHQNSSSSDGRAHASLGLWLIGARGSVATTVALGLHAITVGLVAPHGCTTTGPHFTNVPLAGLDDIVVGGHDIGTVSLVEKARALAAGGMFRRELVDAVEDRLDETDRNIRLAFAASTESTSQHDEIERQASDIIAFRDRHGLRRVIVIDVASTEPFPADRPEFHDVEALRAALSRRGGTPVPRSSVSALAAVAAGSPYASFTPSTSLAPPALREWATEAGVPFAGQDGKTGETLLRSVLAPLFTSRGMHVMSWAGTNLLGGGDGATLGDPEAVQSKLASKNRGLISLLGEHVHTPLHIDNVPDLGDIKTAWDHVHASGFLDSRITLQTTWSAYDSTLAAPLVIDLARLLDLAGTAGLTGPVPELGFFFKDPWGSDIHGFADQTVELIRWAERTGRAVAARQGQDSAPDREFASLRADG